MNAFFMLPQRWLPSLKNAFDLSLDLVCLIIETDYLMKSEQALMKIDKNLKNGTKLLIIDGRKQLHQLIGLR